MQMFYSCESVLLIYGGLREDSALQRLGLAHCGIADTGQSAAASGAIEKFCCAETLF
jgi:hypothetical protein